MTLKFNDVYINETATVPVVSSSGIYIPFEIHFSESAIASVTVRIPATSSTS